MSSLIFPTLPGMGIAVKRSPVFSTLVQNATSGKEVRVAYQSCPRWRYEIPLNFLRDTGFSVNTAYDELATIANFFNVHQGSWDSFLFTDPADNAVTAHGFGVGTGAATAFQLQRTQGGQYTNVLGTFSVPTTPRTNRWLQSSALGTAPNTLSAATLTAGAGLAPDGTLTAWKLAEDATTNSHNLNQTVVYGNETISQTFYAKAAERGWCRAQVATPNGVWVNLATGVLGTQDAGTIGVVTALPNGWWRIVVTATLTAGTNYPAIMPVTGNGVNSYAGTVGNGILIWQPQNEVGVLGTEAIATVASAVTVTPSYYPGTGSGFEPITEPVLVSIRIYRQDWQGIQLLYPTSRTNLVLQSQTMDNASWIVTRAAVAANSIAAPDSTVTAERLTEDATATNTHLLYLAADCVVVNGSTYTSTVYAKAGTRSWFQLSEGQGATAGVYFNLATGAIGTVSGTGSPSATIKDLGNGWYRCTLTFNAIGTAARIRCFMATGDGGGIYTGDGASYMYFWGAQMEAGAVATPYIPTTTAAVTVTDYTLTASGAVTFSVAPALNAALTWTGSYYRRCRFETDQVDFEQFLNLAWKGGAMKLISVK